MRRLVRFTPLLALFGLVLSTAGCDALAEKLGIDKVDVPMSSVGTGLSVSGTASAKSGTVNRGGDDLPNVFDVESVTLDPANLSYTPGSGKASAMQTGEITVVLLLAQVPAGQATITVTNNQVTNVQPRPISLGSFNRARIEQMIAEMPAAQRPAIQSLDGLTASQIQDKINAAIKASTPFPAAIMVAATGDLTGTLNLSKITLNLDF